MDKREEEILDDILGGEETEDFENLDGYEEIIIPESLKGDSDDENENENKSEETEKPEESVIIDSDLDKALSKFVDDDDDDEEPKKNKKTNGEYKKIKTDREEIEREIREQIAGEKAKKFKMIRNIVAICLAVVLVVGAGLFLFLYFDRPGNYVLTFDGKKISMEEFKYFLLLNQGTEDPIQESLNAIEDFLIIEKIAKENNVSLSQEEKNDIKEYIDYVINNYGIQLNNLKISEDRLIELFGWDNLYYHLLEHFTEEVDVTMTAEQLAAEVANYRLSSRIVKYILTDNNDDAEEVRNALRSGLSVDEAVINYSLLYDETYGVETIDLYQLTSQLYQNYGLMITENNYNKVMNLNAAEFTEGLNLGYYVVFIPATEQETEEWLREIHAESDYSEEDFIIELEEFRLTEKLMKYILTETKESAEEAYNALASGSITTEEAIKQYSIDYAESQAINKIELSAVRLTDKENADIMSLHENEYSKVIELGPFIIVIEATNKETEDTVKQYQASQLLDEEYEYWITEIKSKINDKALNDFDVQEYYSSMYAE